MPMIGGDDEAARIPAGMEELGDDADDQSDDDRHDDAVAVHCVTPFRDEARHRSKVAGHGFATECGRIGALR